jgi:hypothetical protein
MIDIVDLVLTIIIKRHLDGSMEHDGTFSWSSALVRLSVAGCDRPRSLLLVFRNEEFCQPVAKIQRCMRRIINLCCVTSVLFRPCHVEERGKSPNPNESFPVLLPLPFPARKQSLKRGDLLVIHSF